MSRHNFREASRTSLADPGLASKVHKATLHTVALRSRLVETMHDWEELRIRAREARLRAIDNLDALLTAFYQAMKARGVSVSLAKSSEEARSIIVELAHQAKGKDGPLRVTKSKSMTTEEIALNSALEESGAIVTETDLGELIVQLAGQRPSHVTAPAIHLSTEDIARIFRDKLNMQVPPWIDDDQPANPDVRRRLALDLSLAARAHLRERFFGADVGITGANFLVAESGTVVLFENEGNIMLTTALPRRHIVVAGIDKLIETEADLGVLMRLLPVSATGQRQSSYVSFLADAHPDMHVVLLDNGRSGMKADRAMRDVLTCVRCGACMNACPVYRTVGGHAYGGAYPGPIGALLMPFIGGLDRFADLPFASSLCGACAEACPVKLPIPDRLLTLRTRITEREGAGCLTQPLRLAAASMASGTRMQHASRVYPWAKRLASFHPVGKAWLASRDMPPAPRETFRKWWTRHRAPDPKQPKNDANAQPSLKPKPHAEPSQFDAPQLSEIDLLQTFRQRIEELGPDGTTEIHAFDDPSVAAEFVRIRCDEHPRDRLGGVGHTLEKREYSLGVSRAAALIADTGGIVFDMNVRSLAYPIMLSETHLVLAKPSQLVASIPDAIALRTIMRKTDKWGDYQIIVTGPSRTADVEKVLVIPAHGPRRLVVVLCEGDVDLAGMDANV